MDAFGAEMCENPVMGSLFYALVSPWGMVK